MKPRANELKQCMDYISKNLLGSKISRRFSSYDAQNANLMSHETIADMATNIYTTRQNEKLIFKMNLTKQNQAFAYTNFSVFHTMNAPNY